jgi:hypothetical protein
VAEAFWPQVRWRASEAYSGGTGLMEAFPVNGVPSSTEKWVAQASIAPKPR